MEVSTTSQELIVLVRLKKSFKNFSSLHRANSNSVKNPSLILFT